MVTILVVAVAASLIVTQRKLARAARAFALGVLKASEDERRRVARELHDDVGQRIGGLCQRLETLQERLRTTEVDPPLITATVAVGDGLREVAATVRQLAHNMHPSVLEHLGLGAALQSLARDVTAESGLHVTARIEAGTDELSPEASLALYRVCQEALRNCIKHARATSATVELSRVGTIIRLSVSDNGVGFAPGQAAGDAGLGLVSLRERIGLLKGRFEVVSQPGHGTMVLTEVSEGMTQ